MYCMVQTLPIHNLQLWFREWFEALKVEADLKVARQSKPEGSAAAHPEPYTVHLKPGPIEVHPVQYAALTR